MFYFDIFNAEVRTGAGILTAPVHTPAPIQTLAARDYWRISTILY